MEAKSLFTEFLIVTDCGLAVSVCLSWSVVSFRSSLWRNKDKYGTTVLTFLERYKLSVIVRTTTPKKKQKQNKTKGNKNRKQKQEKKGNKKNNKKLVLENTTVDLMTTKLS